MHARTAVPVPAPAPAPVSIPGRRRKRDHRRSKTIVAKGKSERRVWGEFVIGSGEVGAGGFGGMYRKILGEGFWIG